MKTIERLGKDQKYRENIKKRAKIIRAIRDFFYSQDFLEVSTPTLTRYPGMEPNLDPMETAVIDDSGKTADGGLITSPEYSLKKVLSAGFNRIFEIARVYRNHEPQEGLHNAEFTMLEWYRRDADYKDLMSDCDELLRAVSGNKIKKSRRIRMRDIFLEKTGLDLDKIKDTEALIRAGRTAGFEMKDGEIFDDAFFRIFLLVVEPSLKNFSEPIILYEYPVELASLAKISENPRYAERFELYINGVEIANAFSELSDPVEQRRRFEAEATLRQVLGKPVYPIDEELLEVLPKIGRAGGIALGVDRLIMILLDSKEIKDVMLWPSSELFGNN